MFFFQCQHKVCFPIQPIFLSYDGTQVVMPSLCYLECSKMPTPSVKSVCTRHARHALGSQRNQSPPIDWMLCSVCLTIVSIGKYPKTLINWIMKWMHKYYRWNTVERKASCYFYLSARILSDSPCDDGWWQDNGDIRYCPKIYEINQI